MQITRFFRTVRWIRSQFTEQTEQFLLGRLGVERGDEDSLISILAISHELASVRPKLQSHPDAPAVLDAFDMSSLLDPGFPAGLAKGFLEGPERSGLVRTPEMQLVILGWRTLCSCVDPIEQLTTPKEVIEEKDFDETLTIEQRCDPTVRIPLSWVVEVLGHVEDLYAVIGRILNVKETKPLRVIYTSAGSTVRFDLAGLGEPIKELKNLLVEAWLRLRHRKADKFRANAQAALEGIAVLDKLEKLRQKKSISQEDANNIRARLIKAVIGLFEKGALPREVAGVETVPNVNLITGFQPKMLPPPAKGKGEPKKLPKAKKSKKRAKKKRVQKGT